MKAGDIFVGVSKSNSSKKTITILPRWYNHSAPYNNHYLLELSALPKQEDTEKNRVVKFLEVMERHKSYLTCIKLYDVYFDGLKAVSDWLMDSGCHVTTLYLRNIGEQEGMNNADSVVRHTNIDTLNYLADAISRNKSLVKLEFDCILRKDVHTLDNQRTFINRLSASLKDHPTIIDFSFDYNYGSKYFSDMIRSLPKNLKHLSLFTYGTMMADDVVYLVKNYRLKTLIVKHDKLRICQNKYHTILMNRTLVFGHFYCNFPDDSEKIKEMFQRNRNALDAARKAALCLIAIRKFRRVECGILGLIQFELVVLVAKYILSSYDDPKWDRPNRKRKKARV
jgi:hypothetical protein